MMPSRLRTECSALQHVDNTRWIPPPSILRDTLVLIHDPPKPADTRLLLHCASGSKVDGDRGRRNTPAYTLDVQCGRICSPVTHLTLESGESSSVTPRVAFTIQIWRREDSKNCTATISYAIVHLHVLVEDRRSATGMDDGGCARRHCCVAWMKRGGEFGSSAAERREGPQAQQTGHDDHSGGFFAAHRDFSDQSAYCKAPSGGL
ncbi:uncharacterized protein BDR25DRAFT_6379 [Lindgomyces ingoldianus]|uniref:Uncharacterized protein n=1 Tax=Lindgomyces ingoldianus TaxID=673940 RepID=A0ACB6RFM1_9PLEO|nr:uncharacterized protein BDR25DRAFT_6379 [Lindgomyces ingoldianus]KAF2478006.1 hypothetical protein BDR25DRAFT_6379 [Lindgomyces ingoldianus]